jgi:hypothetical protein
VGAPPFALFEIWGKGKCRHERPARAATTTTHVGADALSAQPSQVRQAMPARANTRPLVIPSEVEGPCVSRLGTRVAQDQLRGNENGKAAISDKGLLFEIGALQL